MTDWLRIRRGPIEAIEHGVEAVADAGLLEATHLGPRTFERIDYPIAEVLPDETQRTGPTEWQHTIVVNLYFRRDRDLDYIDEVLHPTAAVLDATLGELGGVDCVTNYHPESIQDFAGELDNTAVLLVSIRLRATALLDPAEFDA